MINFNLKKARWSKIQVNSSYLKNFPLAVLNWEANRQEDKFAFRRYDVSLLQNIKPSWPA
jgi:hypothetical protein